jgi:DNA-binding NarL/FixJ family response regulator
MQELQKNRPVTRVVIIDDHAVLSELITSVVDSLRNFRVVGRVQTEDEALALCGREQPDLVILDLVLSASSGLTLLEKLGTLCPRTRVAIFSGNLTPGLVAQVLSAGAFGLISKSVTLDEFRAALLAVAAGRTHFSPEISAIIKSLVTDPPLLPTPGRLRLSRREEIVLGYLAQGLSSKEIAALLGVSVYTVANHRSRLMKKTGLHRAAQLSLYAERLGLLRPVAGAYPSR